VGGRELDDARGRLIQLTDRGRAVIDEAVAHHMHNEARLLSGLTADEQLALADLLRKLSRTLPGRR
jgi:DNA-binding MarR family transcriptional regulator